MGKLFHLTGRFLLLPLESLKGDTSTERYTLHYWKLRKAPDSTNKKQGKTNSDWSKSASRKIDITKNLVSTPAVFHRKKEDW
jgi:hypothetical protein